MTLLVYKSNNPKKLISLLNKYLTYAEYDASTGSILKFPDFDLLPYDYLEFAENEINSNDISSKINTVSNLKRALECELDTILNILGLNKGSCKKYYFANVPIKLDFVGKVGLVSPRSFKKLNTLRNKIEHEYHVPSDDEIDSFYDLVFTLISAIDGFILFFGSSKDLDFAIEMEDEKFGLSVTYNENPPSIDFKFSLDRGSITKISFKADNYAEFVFGFGVYLLMTKFTNLVNSDYVLNKVDILYSLYEKQNNT